MKKSTKIVLLVFLILVVIGILLIAAGFISGGSMDRLQTTVTDLFYRIDYDYILRQLVR